MIPGSFAVLSDREATMTNLQNWIVNPILFIIVLGLSVLFVAALLYQILGH